MIMQLLLGPCRQWQLHSEIIARVDFSEVGTAKGFDGSSGRHCHYIEVLRAICVHDS